MVEDEIFNHGGTPIRPSIQVHIAFMINIIKAIALYYNTLRVNKPAAPGGYCITGPVLHERISRPPSRREMRSPAPTFCKKSSVYHFLENLTFILKLKRLIGILRVTPRPGYPGLIYQLSPGVP